MPFKYHFFLISVLIRQKDCILFSTFRSLFRKTQTAESHEHGRQS